MSVWRRLGLLGPALVWMVVIYVVSDQSSLPSLAVGWLDRATKSASHFAEYGILALLLARHPLATQPRLTVRSASLVTALCLLFALSDEYHQLFVPGRVADWADVAADTAGAVTMVSLLTRTGPASLLRRLDPLL
ncbi:MAG: VanZ family protein [Anaerolineae bacterium]|nr:VanZ family protein [Anaerolineae bacterium]